MECPFCYQERIFLLHMPITVSIEEDAHVKTYTRDGYNIKGDNQKICPQCLEHELENLD